MVNLFTASNLFNADIVQVWSLDGPKPATPDPFPELLKLAQPPGGITGLNDGDSFMRRSGAIPGLRPELLASLASTEVNLNLRLQTLAGPLPGGSVRRPFVSRLRATARGPGSKPAPDGTSYLIVVPITLTLGREADATTNPGLFQLDGELILRLDVDSPDASGFCSGSGRSFEVDPQVDFRFLAAQDAKFGDMVSLHVPAGTVLTLVADPAEHALFWNKSETLKTTTERIAVRIPGAAQVDPSANRFTFEIREFSVGQDGFSMIGAVRRQCIPDRGPKLGGRS